jgi:hypothetical protein
LGPEAVSLLERCPHFRGCYVQASIERYMYVIISEDVQYTQYTSE